MQVKLKSYNWFYNRKYYKIPDARVKKSELAREVTLPSALVSIELSVPKKWCWITLFFTMKTEF
jgi:hypothetical protein